MRVLHFLPWHSPQTRGGTEAFLLQLASLQQRSGEVVEVIAPNANDETGTDTVHGVRVRYFPRPYPIPGNRYNLKRRERSRVDFIKAVEEMAPDILHLHGIDYFLVPFFEPLVPDLKLVLTVHLANVICANQTLEDYTGQFCSRTVGFATCANCLGRQRHKGVFRAAFNSISIPVNDRLIRKLDYAGLAERVPYQKSVREQVILLDFLRRNVRIDALTPWFRDVLLRNGFDETRIAVRPNPLYERSSFEVRRGGDLIEGPVKFLFVGRLSIDKGIGVLADALCQLADLRDELSVTLVGRQDDHTLLEKLGKPRSEGLNINTMGERSSEQVKQHLATADFLIFPSLRGEMAPLVIQEALRMGVPVLGANTPAVSALIEDGLNGYVFERGNAQSLALAMRTIVERKRKPSFTVRESKEADAKLLSYYCSLYSG